MARRYTVTFENVAVSAAQDLLQIKGASNKVLRIINVWLSAGVDTTLVTAQGLRIRCRYMPATVTDGSGGSSPTPQAVSPGDAAASFTAKANNTTPATTNGTAAQLHADGVHIFAGHSYAFPTPPEIISSTSFTYELLSTVSGTVHLSGGVTVEELG